MDEREKQVQNTEKTASSNMMRFVAIIFAIALVLAALWFFFLTPGDPSAIAS